MCSPTPPTSTPSGTGRSGSGRCGTGQRVGGVAAREVVGRQAERARDACHHAVPERGQRVDVVEHGCAQARQHVVAGNRLRPCSGMPARTRGWSSAQLGAEVEAFLPVGPARGQLAAEREPAAPGRPPSAIA